MSALRIGPLAAAAAFALVLVAVAVAAPGDLDPTFGVNGRVTLSPFVESYASSIAVQPDGKLVLAGTADDEVPPPPPPPAPGGPFSSNRDFLAVRLTPDGSVDHAFGSGGAVRTSIDPGGSGGADGAGAVAIAPDGRVVVAGFTIAPGGGSDFAVIRYTSTGSLDPTFSGDGIQTVDVGTVDVASGVAVQPDGKVVAVGPGGSGFTVVRLLPSGRLDSSFGNGGVVDMLIGNPGLRDDAAAVLLRNGKIVVAGTADIPDFRRNDFAVVRLLAGGQPDPGFGTGGIVVTRSSGEERAYALAPAPGNKIAVAGLDGGGHYRVARYLADGSLDRTFGGTGRVTTAFQGLIASALGIGVQADGKLVAAGLGLSGDESAFTAARYQVNGSLDSSFSGDGKGVYELPTVRFWGGGMVLQRGTDPAAAGRLVIVGQTFEGSSDHLVATGVDLGRLEPPPPPAKCRVPLVVGLTIAKARRKIRRVYCSVGRVRRVKARRFRGIVVRQSPRAGRRLTRGARVNLVVGR